MKFNNAAIKNLAWVVCLTIGSLMTACGGGGGSSHGESAPAPARFVPVNPGIGIINALFLGGSCSKRARKRGRRRKMGVSRIPRQHKKRYRTPQA
jgi:hypothetical protein